MVKAHQLERKRRQFHSMGNLREGGGGTTVTGEMAPTLVLNFLGGFFEKNSNFYKFLPTGKNFKKSGNHSWRVFQSAFFNKSLSKRRKF